jgi:CRP-like cAMP-binding protein
MVRKNADIALRMLKKMGKRLNESQFRVSNFVFRTTEGRLLHQLRHEAEQAGEDDDLTGPTPIPDDLAAVLSVDVGELKALLNTFIDRELISIDSEGHFRIPDPAEYDRYLSYLELKDRYDYSES